MERQLIGPATTGTAGFSDQFSPNHSDLAQLFIPHGPPSFQSDIIIYNFISLREDENVTTDQQVLPRKRGQWQFHADGSAMKRGPL